MKKNTFSQFFSLFQVSPLQSDWSYISLNDDIEPIWTYSCIAVFLVVLSDLWASPTCPEAALLDLGVLLHERKPTGGRNTYLGHKCWGFLPTNSFQTVWVVIAPPIYMWKNSCPTCAGGSPPSTDCSCGSTRWTMDFLKTNEGHQGFPGIFKISSGSKCWANKFQNRFIDSLFCLNSGKGYWMILALLEKLRVICIFAWMNVHTTYLWTSVLAKPHGGDDQPGSTRGVSFLTYFINLSLDVQQLRFVASNVDFSSSIISHQILTKKTCGNRSYKYIHLLTTR